MIEYIFKSKIREKILSLLFLNPVKEFYVNELARMFSVSVGSLHKELRKLLKNGILKVNSRGNLKLYSINKDYHFWDELKEILKKSIGVEEKIRLFLSKFNDVKCAFIYGSWAKKQIDQYSDIDIFIIGKIDEEKLLDFINKFENEILREINYTIFTEAEIKKRIKDKDYFFEGIIENSKIFLKGDEKYLSKFASRRSDKKGKS